MTCTVVHDESTESLVDASPCAALSGEITDHFISQGYEPPGKWEPQRFDAERGSIEAMRNFKVEKRGEVNDAEMA